MTMPQTTPHSQTHLENLLLSVLDKLLPGSGGPSRNNWLRPTTQGIINLPWTEADLPDGRLPPRHSAAASLLVLLLKVLECDTPPPTSINPTGDGGVTAQWHLPGYDLEIFCEPDQPPEYLLSATSINHESNINNEEDTALLRRHLALMPKHEEP